MATTLAPVTRRPEKTTDWSALARTHYENFPVGSWLVPLRLRPHIHAIYAFARVADDLADEHRDATALAAMRASFVGHLEGTAAPTEPMLAAVTATIRALDLPESLFFDLLDAFALDLTQSRHDEASLLAYCTKSADPVGRLVLRVFGWRDPALDARSDRICTGLQLLNHLQDIGEDLCHRDRIYFPTLDLARHGVTEADLAAATATPGVRALVREWHGRITGMFAQGWPLLSAVRGRLRLELRAIVWGAVLCLRRIAAADFDVLAARAHLTRGDKLSLPLRALLGLRPRELR